MIRERLDLVVLMASHNRVDSTVRALTSLRKSVATNLSYRVYLYDSASTDDTVLKVEREFPEVSVLCGLSSHYWAAGMARAEERATDAWPCFDFLLWLNDDVCLREMAISNLIQLSLQQPESIVVGGLEDPDRPIQTYGALKRVQGRPAKFHLLPMRSLDDADTFNGNVVLLPWTVWRSVGKIDGAYGHALADIDYGLRATALGIPIVQSPTTVGHCARNPVETPPRVPWRRWRFFQDPKRLPLGPQKKFLRRHGGFFWWLYFGWHVTRSLAPLQLPGASRSDRTFDSDA